MSAPAPRQMLVGIVLQKCWTPVFRRAVSIVNPLTGWRRSEHRTARWQSIFLSSDFRPSVLQPFPHRRNQLLRLPVVQRRRMAREIFRDGLRRPGRKRVTVFVLGGFEFAEDDETERGQFPLTAGNRRGHQIRPTSAISTWVRRLLRVRSVDRPDAASERPDGTPAAVAPAGGRRLDLLRKCDV
jgi:hypothetical protein